MLMQPMVAFSYESCTRMLMSIQLSCYVPPIDSVNGRSPAVFGIDLFWSAGEETELVLFNTGNAMNVSALFVAKKTKAKV